MTVDAMLVWLARAGYAVCISTEGHLYNVSLTHPDKPRRNYGGTGLEGTIRLALRRTQEGA